MPRYWSLWGYWKAVNLLRSSGIRGVDFDGGWDDHSVGDDGVVLDRDGVDLDGFAASFVEAIAEHRHWHRANKEQVSA
jgi:catalase